MKKCISFLTLVVFSTHISLFAQSQTSEPSPVVTVESTQASAQNTQTVSREPTGSGAAQSSRTGRSTSWQNWVFASAALAIAATGVIVVAINSGHDNHSAH